MFKLLSDLRRFFTKKELADIIDLQLSDIPFISLMASVVPIIKDDIYYLRMCEDLQQTDNFDMEFLANVDITLVTNHWGDILGCLSHKDRGNSLTRMLLLTFCDPNDFTFLNCWINGYDYKHEGIDLTVGERHVDGYIKEWFCEEMGPCRKDSEDDEAPGDLYDDENTEMASEVLLFKNKSLGRKIRKLYAKNPIVRSLFQELGYNLVNGQFVTVYWLNLECYDPYYGEYTVIDLIEGVEEMRKELRLEPAERDLTDLTSSLNELRNEAYKENSNMSMFINRLMNLYHTEREIIL